MKRPAPRPLAAKSAPVSLFTKSSKFPPLAPGKFLLPVFLLAVFLLLAVASAKAQSEKPQRSESERNFFDLLNHERSAQGLPELRWDEALSQAARLHVLRLSSLNTLEHQVPGEPALVDRLTEAGARFSVIAENIGVGPNPRAIHSGWMDSPGHRKNILDPRFTSVGIAAVRAAGGLFVVQDFVLSVSSFSVEEQEKKVAALLAEAGWLVSGSEEEARKACETDRIEKGTGPRAMVRFETPDLIKLPEEVDKRMRDYLFRNVAIGACLTGAAPGFARFRVALLLF